MPLSWSRAEPFGAWVRLDDATLLAVDAGLAAKLGVASGGPAREAPLELHLAVTARCHAPCRGCYLDARPDGAMPSFDELRARLEEAAASGVSTVAFGGGEPLLRGDLGELAEVARALRLVPVMTTSGLGLDAARASTLRAFAQVNVSYDGASEAYAAVRGFDASAHAERAIGALRGAGVAVGVNVVLTRASFGSLEATARRAAELGARELQLLRYKPAGRAASAEYAEARLDEAQIELLFPTIERIARMRKLAVRVDCAMVPLLSSAPLVAADLLRFGVFGCEAGRHLGALRVDGTAAPCSFFTLPDAQRPGSLPLVAPSVRAYHQELAEPCSTCDLASVCRGGCQVVSLYATGELGPDPECPRVRRARAR